MKCLCAVIYTCKDISTKSYANSILKILENNGVLPDKIGLYEPLREQYEKQKAIQYWQVKKGRDDFYRGELCARHISPKIDYSFVWHKGKKARPNCITIYCYGKYFFEKYQFTEKIFKEFIIEIDSFYGYISDFDICSRQYLPSTIVNRISGIFWCNYFGPLYLQFMNEKRLNELNWYKTINWHTGKIFYITKSPNSEELKSDSLEISFKEKIGIRYFGDSKLLNANIDKKQDTVAPKLDLSELFDQT